MRFTRLAATAALLLTWTLATGCANPLKGTYVLSHRQLPDGTVQHAPDVLGCMTFTNRHRNFHIRLEEADGSTATLMSVSEYSLTADGYAEKPLYYLRVDSSGEVVERDMSWSARTPVTREDGRLSFRLPLFDEPTLTFERMQMIATEPGAFTDYWEKVE